MTEYEAAALDFQLPLVKHASLPEMRGPTKDAAFHRLIVVGFRLNPV